MFGRTTKVRMAAVAAVAAATVGTLASLAGPAQAYDRSTCYSRFGSANYERGDMFRTVGYTGKVDFGDILHLGGAPQGNAVVCWLRTGGVGVVGRVFADGGGELVSATATITYYNNGVPGTPQYHSVMGRWAENKAISEFVPSGNVTRVRIRLTNFGVEAANMNFYRSG